jgi:quercetin dioxygenase-like cupin family protein
VQHIVIKAIVANSSLQSAVPINGNNTVGLSEWWLIRVLRQSPNFDIRYIEIQPSEISKNHNHPWEQANYILTGECELTVGKERYVLREKDFAFIPLNESHQFRNLSGDQQLTLLCIQGPKFSEC